MSEHLTPRAWPVARARTCAVLLAVPASVAFACAGPARSAPFAMARLAPLEMVRSAPLETARSAPLAMARPASTSGPQAPATIAAVFHPDRLGAMGSFTVAIDLGAGAVGDQPPLRSSVLRLPAGLGIEVPHLRACEPERLRLLGARGCPLQAKIGSGQALVRAQLGSQLLEESVSLSVFLGPLHNLQPTFEMLAQGYTPFDERVVLSGAVLPDDPPYSEDLVLPVPAIATLPLEPDASVASMSLTIGSSRHSSREPNTAVEPTRCPSGGFPFAAELTYADGSTQSVSTASPCP
jgi:hypothetical protein